jgi:hypothetical protein
LAAVADDLPALPNVTMFDPISGEAITMAALPADLPGWMLVDGARHARASRVAWEKNAS